MEVYSNINYAFTVMNTLDMNEEFANYPTPSTGSEGSVSPGSYLGNGNSQMEAKFADYYRNDEQMDTNIPHLKVIVEPVEKFRFRYKSEMAGTHGCLMGRAMTNKNRKSVFPSVALMNFTGEAIIRCSLYQTYTHVPKDSWQPHPHRLVLKDGDDEIVDPHHKTVTEKENWTCLFRNMGIIHTSKKHLKDELMLKMIKLKMEDILRKEQVPRELKPSEKIELEAFVAHEEKTVNTNIVCLRFDAFQNTNGILYPICDPVYSTPIFNLKSAMTGDLRIARMDHCTSPASGKKEIYLLVEKVTRKNIKVRFFEIDEDDDSEIWSAYGSFSDADVHRQYAIVLKTPCYKDLQIDSEKRVFIQLERPSDGAKSEPKPFMYIPDRSKVRKRARYDSSSTSFASSEITNRVVTTVQLNSEELSLYARDVNSKDFTEMMLELDIDYLSDRCVINTDADAVERTRENRKQHIVCKGEAIILSQFNDFVSFLKTKPTAERIVSKMKSLFKCRNDHSDETNVFHECFSLNYPICNKFALYLIEVIKKHQLYDLLDMRNRNGESVVHVAIKNGAEIDQLQWLPLNYLDLMLKDEFTGQYPLHLAAIHHYGVIDLIKTNKIKIDQINDGGRTALQLAVEEGDINIVKLLVSKGASLRIVDRRNGNNLLHDAVSYKHPDIVEFLMSFPAIDIEQQNYAGYDCVEMAQHLPKGEDAMKIVALLCPDFANVSLKEEVMSEDSEETDEEFEDVDDIVVKNEPQCNDYETVYNKAALVKKDWIPLVSKMVTKARDTENLYTALNFNYMLHTNVPNGENSVEFLLNLALKNGLTAMDIKKAFGSLNMHEAVRCIDATVIKAIK